MNGGQCHHWLLPVGGAVLTRLIKLADGTPRALEDLKEVDTCDP